VLNSGSSSLKFGLFTYSAHAARSGGDEALLLEGSAEGMGGATAACASIGRGSGGAGDGDSHWRGKTDREALSRPVAGPVWLRLFWQGRTALATSFGGSGIGDIHATNR
jgi:hypothetical protein